MAILILAAMLLMAGCASNTDPTTIVELPVPQELTIYEGVLEPTLDMVAVGLQEAYGPDAGDVEIRYYWAPDEMNWEQVENFYRDQLSSSDSGWEMDQEAALHNSDLWTRSTSSGDQKLVITMVPVSDGEGYLMMMALFTPK